MQFLEVYKTIDTLTNKMRALKAEKSLNRADSINKLLIDYQSKLEALSSDFGLDLELTEINCITYFGLDSMSLNEQKVNYLFIYNAYILYEPRYVACGIGPTITSEKEYEIYLDRMAKARNNHANYIDSMLSKAMNSSFAKVSEKERTAFYHSSEVILKRNVLFGDSFSDSASVYARKDSTFMELVSAMEKARYSEL